MKKIILAVLAFMSISTMAQDFQWVKDFSENDPATFEIADIEVGSDGNVYVMINIDDDFDLTPGASEYVVHNYGKKDCIIASYSPEGELLSHYHIKSIGGTTIPYPDNLADEVGFDMVFSGSYLCVLGAFEDDFEFHTQDPSSVLSIGNYERKLFLAQMKIYGNGIIQDSIVTTPGVGGSSTPANFLSGKIFYHGPNDELFIAGTYTGTFEFASTYTLTTSDLHGDIFFGKVNAGDGSFVWGKAIKSASDNKETVANILVHPDYEYIYLAGTFDDDAVVDFNPSATVNNLTSAGLNDIYLSMYTSAGNYISSSYIGKIGSNGNDTIQGFDMDGSGNLYLACNIPANKTIDVDIKSATTNNIMTLSGANGLLIKYDYALNDLAVLNLGNDYECKLNQMYVDINNHICVMGYFNNEIDLNPLDDELLFNSTSGQDLFFGKYNTNLISYKLQQIVDISANEMLMGVNKFSNSMALYGKFTGAVDFDPGSGVYYATPSLNQNGRFLALYNHCILSNITINPISQNVCEDGVLNLTTSATGTNLTYQWYKNSLPISNGVNSAGTVLGANTNSLHISDITASAADLYYCQVLSTCNSAINTNSANITVDLKPVISSNPGNQTSCEGTNVSFSVAASNTTSYRWLLNNGSGTFAPITDNATYSGSQTATLTINNIQPSQSYFQYKCQVGGTCPPELFSYPATLVVNPNPNIQTQPSNTAICQGTSGSFSISTVGSGLNYQWQMSTDGTNFSNLSNNATYSGVTSSSLNIANAALALNQNQYRCVVSGTCGSNISSNAASLTVNAITTLNSHPTDQTVCENGNVILNVNAQGYNLQYQWQANSGSGWSYLSNGGQYSNVNNSSLNIGSVNTSNSGSQYRCVISSGCSANINSNSAALTVSQTPNVSIVSASGTDACQGQTLMLTLTGTQIGYTYQWTRNFSNLASATQNQLSITQGGAYSVITENSNGCSSESDLIYINYHAVPNVALTTVGYDAFCQGEYAELFVPAGMGNTYQWYQNTSPLLQNSNALIVTESGTYHVVVSNIYGCVSNSVDKTITVHQLPDVSLLPSSDIELCTGSTDTIFAVENPNYFYQWQRNHNDINGANTSQLVVQQSGAFQVDIYDNSTGCMNTSDATFVQMLPLPQAQIQSSNILTFCVNDSSLLNTTVIYNTYQWWNGSTQNQTYVSAPGTYALTVSDANGCQNTTQITITEVLVETPPICMVSVDTAYNKNLIVWQNPVGVQGIESYNIYKLVSSSFQLIGNVAYTDTTEFVDFNSEPNIHSDQYAIASVDDCGQIGAYSAYHQTMNLSIVDAVGSSLALIWTPYIDEGGLNNPTEYQIYRGVESLSYYASISGGLSDYNYNIPSFEAGERFIIVVQRPEGCSPMYHLSRASGGPYYQSTSNLEDEGIINTKVHYIEANGISVYPNPAKEFTMVNSVQKIESLKVFSASGQLVATFEPNTFEYQLETKTLESGVYLILINDNQRIHLIKE